MSMPARRIFDAVTPGAIAYERPHARYGKFIWKQSPLEGYANDIDRRYANNPTILKAADARSIGSGIFDENTVLEETLSAFGDLVSEGSITEVEGRFLTGGQRGLLFMHRVRNGGNDRYFVTYISRGADNDSDSGALTIASETRQEFDNMSNLHQAFESRLTAEGKAKYEVAKPLVSGSFAQNGLNYPFYTMEYLPYREIIVGGQPIPLSEGRIATIPFFMYGQDNTAAINDSSDAREQVIRQAHETRDAIMAAFDHTLRREASNPNEMRPSWVQKRHDLLVGYALVYLLTNKRFPKETEINAGDWVGIMNDTGGFDKLGLITLRGGLSGRQLSEPEVWSILQGKVEQMLLSGLENLTVRPFGDLIPDEWQNEIIPAARSLIVSN